MIRSEVAMSNYDANTFSTINNGDDNGFAARVQVNNAKPLREKNKLQLLTSLDYEYVQSKFKPLERLRTVEFSRDWGLSLFVNRKQKTSSVLRPVSGIIRITDLHTGLRNYKRGETYNGFQNAVQQMTDWKGLDLQQRGRNYKL